ncbi:Ig-like domain-containing protein [Aphelenchoides besseyi]|nr:Ig-like domain-containing protein [Aphelenchoides besseyi]
MGIAPFFDGKPSIINRPDGSVLFECMVNGNPEPTKELTGDRFVKKVKKQVGKYVCTLIMKNPTQVKAKADQGVFKVLATNPHGKHSVEQNYVANCVANEVFKTQ